MVLSSVVLSLGVGVGKEDAVDVVKVGTPEIMLEDELEDELDDEIILVGFDEGAWSLEAAELIE